MDQQTQKNQFEELKGLLEQVSGLDLLLAISHKPLLLKQFQEAIVEKGMSKKDQVLVKERELLGRLHPKIPQHQDFQELITMIEKTKNVNRSNITAVLAVAGRRSETLKELTDFIHDDFHGDSDQIANFFKEYFEVVKGWKFNKYNRKEGIQSGLDLHPAIIGLAERLEEADSVEALLRWVDQTNK